MATTMRKEKALRALPLGDRLQQRRHELFVGRTAERARFLEILDSMQARVLFVHGQGGVGKTALLQELLHTCHQRGIAAARIDGGQLEPSPSALLSSLAELTGAPIESAAELGTLGVRVLMIDTYETLEPLEAWVRETFLPALPAEVLVVLAGREPPSSAWLADSGWHHLLERLPLAELSDDDSRDYLTRRGISEIDQHAVLGFARGHALALSLVADVCEQAPAEQRSFVADAHPDVVHALVEQLVRGLPDPAQRHALEACAVARTTTEPLLAAMLESTDVHQLFDWLRGLSFMQSDRVGLYPHDLARKALVADLSFRDPDRLRALNQRALGFLLERSASGLAADWRSAAVDCLYTVLQLLPQPARKLLRDRRIRGLWSEAATARDVPSLLALVERHEGSDSAALAEHWFSRQLHHVTVIRDGSMEPAGLFAILGLDGLGDDELGVDPAVAAAARLPARLGSSGRSAAMLRFWMARDTYQSLSPVQALCASLINHHHVSWPQLGFSFLPFAHPDEYDHLATLGGYQRTPTLDFTVGGRRYGMFARDWRRVPPLEFLAQLVRTGQPAPEPLPWSRESFAEAVRLALRHLHDPLRLTDHPLLGTELVQARAAASHPALARPEALHALLVETIASLGGSARSRKLQVALHATFVGPVGTQEETAEALDIPLSTYRRHLTDGIQEVTDRLWRLAGQ